MFYFFPEFRFCTSSTTSYLNAMSYLYISAAWRQPYMVRRRRKKWKKFMSSIDSSQLKKCKIYHSLKSKKRKNETRRKGEERRQLERGRLKEWEKRKFSFKDLGLIVGFKDGPKNFRKWIQSRPKIKTLYYSYSQYIYRESINLIRECI